MNDGFDIENASESCEAPGLVVTSLVAMDGRSDPELPLQQEGLRRLVCTGPLLLSRHNALAQRP